MQLFIFIYINIINIYKNFITVVESVKCHESVISIVKNIAANESMLYSRYHSEIIDVLIAMTIARVLVLSNRTSTLPASGRHTSQWIYEYHFSYTSADTFHPRIRFTSDLSNF